MRTSRTLRTRRRWWLLASAVLAPCALLVPAASSASTVSVRTHPDPALGDEIVYVATRGEKNRLRIRQVGDETSTPFSATWILTDPGAHIRTGEACTSIDEHTAQCGTRPIGPIWGYRVHLNDGDDRLDVESPSPPNIIREVVADGGTGDDLLFGGEANDQLDGGGGRDELRGGGGFDVLSDGDQDSATGDLEPGPDLFDGGTDLDAASYEQRTMPVVVDLADRRSDGGPREGDRLRHVESITGGQGDDRLAGDRGRNAIDGQDGQDRLVGRAGDDEFSGGGNPISCGPGHDIVHGGSIPPGLGSPYPPPPRSPLDYLLPDCERVAATYFDLSIRPYPAVVRPRFVGFRISCSPDSYGDPVVCGGSLRLRESSGRRRPLASATFPRGRWVGRLVRARLTPLGRLLGSSRGGVRATVKVEGHHFDSPTRWSIRLKVP